MRNPQDLYETSTEPSRPVPVLVHALTGSVDAGHAGRLVTDHLLSRLPSRTVATFDVDQLIDYRARRPTMTYDSGAWVDYEEPHLRVDLLHDDEGVPLLLLHGAEPDLHWESFVRAVESIIEDFDVETTIGVRGIPMGVPHTRPPTVTAHATRAELIADHPNMIGTVQVPGSATSLLEYRLGHHGHDALGFAANVPHYLHQTDFPPSAAELVRQVARSSGLSLPVGDLEAEAVRVVAEIDRQVSESEEVGAVVRALEQQYDAITARFEQTSDRAALTPPQDLPSADELGAQVEAFLAGKDLLGPGADPGSEDDS